MATHGTQDLDWMERDLIGHMIVDPTIIDEHIAARIEARDIIDPIRRAIFEATTDVYRNTPRGEPISPMLVTDVATRMSKVSRETIADAIMVCVESSANSLQPSSIVYHMLEVLERRRLEAAGLEIVKTAQRGASGRAVAEESIQILAEAVQRNERQSFVDATTAITNAIDGAFRGKAAKRVIGVRVIDELLGGYPIGSLNVIAARPSGGKTTFGVHLARRYACAGGAAAFISMEMSEDEIGLILAAQFGDVSHESLTRGKLTEVDMTRVLDGVGTISDRTFKIRHDPRMTCEKLVASITRQAKRNGISLFVVDYLQRLTLARRGRMPRHEELGEITRELKSTAGELGIIIVLLSQMNREIEKEKKPRYPRMSDLGDSGNTERDADSVSFLWPWINEKGSETPASNGYEKTAFVCAKHRHGRNGLRELHWTKGTRSFYEPA